MPTLFDAEKKHAEYCAKIIEEALHLFHGKAEETIRGLSVFDQNKGQINKGQKWIINHTSMYQGVLSSYLKGMALFGLLRYDRKTELIPWFEQVLPNLTGNMRGQAILALSSLYEAIGEYKKATILLEENIREL